jgi:hypothetical protein
MRVVVPALASIALAILGLWILVAHLLGDLRRWNEFKSAKEAAIHSVESLNLTAKGAGGKSFASLEVVWSYEVGGKRFLAESLSIHKTRDNFDGFRHRLYRRLKSDNPGKCFYLQDHPQEAVLDRSLRPATIALSSLFSVIPLALGLFFGRAAIYELRSSS